MRTFVHCGAELDDGGVFSIVSVGRKPVLH